MTSVKNKARTETIDHFLAEGNLEKNISVPYAQKPSPLPEKSHHKFFSTFGHDKVHSSTYVSNI